jgi:hypothetical protein
MRLARSAGARWAEAYGEALSLGRHLWPRGRLLRKDQQFDSRKPNACAGPQPHDGTYGSTTASIPRSLRASSRMPSSTQSQ